MVYSTIRRTYVRRVHVEQGRPYLRTVPSATNTENFAGRIKNTENYMTVYKFIWLVPGVCIVEHLLWFFIQPAQHAYAIRPSHF